MGRRLFSAAAAVAASLLVLALPAVSRAQTAPSPSAAHTTQAYLLSLMARGNKECIQPPRHFDLKTLSDAQLALYGLPTRRVLEGDPLYWSHMLDHYKHRACGPDIMTHPRGLSHGLARPRASKTRIPRVSAFGSNWAGNFAYGARGTYKAAQVTATVPVISGHIGALAYFWAGVGGQQSITGNSTELVQSGQGVMICPDGYTGPECFNDEGSLPTTGNTWRYNFAWYEIVNNSSSGCPASIYYCNPVIMSGMSIYAGQSLTAYVSSNAPGEPYDYFEVCNNTSSTCANSVENSHSDSFSDSATGECIGEEPAVTDKGGSDYYEANYGTEYLSGCYVENNSGLGQGIQDWTHSYTWGQNAEGYTLQSVGSILHGTDYDLFYCTHATTTNDFCG
jgi:hypothetical protein